MSEVEIEMVQREHFGDVFAAYMKKVGQTDGRLAELTGVPKPTIVSWREGRVRHPRNILDVLSVAEGLRLTQAELDKLLWAAGYKGIGGLLDLAEHKKDQELLEKLAKWTTNPLTNTPYPDSRLTPFQAPAQLPGLVGREEMITAMLHQLRPGKTICTLHGMAGVGKTMLAVHMAYELRSDFPDGVLWANLEQASDEDSSIDPTALMRIIHTFTSAFGRSVADIDNLADRSRVLREVLATKRVLVVLDNAHSTADVEPLLPPSTCPGAILITTRNRQVLEGLATPFTLAPFSQDESMQFLRQVLGDERVDAEKIGAQLIINLLGQLPLALRIVASDLALTKELTLLESYEELEEERTRLDHLTHWSDSSKSVRASFEVSYRRLSLNLKRLFATLGAFTGLDFGSAAAAALNQFSLTQTKHLLSHLYALSLIIPGASGVDGDLSGVKENMTRYHLHTLLRLFAREKLTESSQMQETTYENLANYFSQFAELHKQDYEAIDVEWDNIRGALHWAQQTGNNELASRLINALVYPEPGIIGYLDARGHWRDAQRYLSWIARQNTLDEQSLAFARLYWQQGAFAFRLADDQGAATALDAAARILNSLDPSSSVAFERAFLAEFQARLAMHKDNEAAMSTLETGIEALRSINSPAAHHHQGYLHVVASTVLGQMMGLLQHSKTEAQRGLGLLAEGPSPARLSGLMNLCAIGIFSGDLAAAAEYADNAIEQASQLGDQRRLALAYMNRGTIARRQGMLPMAVLHQQQALKLFERFGDVRSTAGTLNNLGMAFTMLGEHASAASVLNQAAGLASSQKLVREEALALATLARVQIRENQLEAARASLTRAESLSRQHRLVETLPSVISRQAELAMKTGAIDAALPLAEQAVQLAQMGGYIVEEGIAWSVKADVLDRHREFTAAEPAHRSSLKLLAQKEPYEQACARAAFAVHWLLRGDVGRSEKEMQQARQVFENLQAKWDLQQMNQWLQQRAETQIRQSPN